MTTYNMENMAHYNTNGPKNGVKSVEGPREQNGVSRPFTLQESLPYSPQTSTVPFLPGKNLGFVMTPLVDCMRPLKY